MFRLLTDLLGLVLLIAVPAVAQTQPDVVITFDRRSCAIAVTGATDSSGVSFRFDDVRVDGRSITAGSILLIAGDSLFVGNTAINLLSLSVADAQQVEGKYLIRLTDASAAAQSRRGRAPADRFGSFSTLEIPAADFIRGSVLAVGGEIIVRGEVNGYVVALFGDIDLTETAACHRDVYAIGGRLQRHNKARVYGALQSTDSWKRSDIFRRRKRLYGQRPVDWMQHFSYNRVDGVTLEAGISFHSEENAMPRFFGEVGYGTSSERWKYRLGFDQRLFDYNQLSYGGSVHRQTRTDDEWICGRDENTAYSLLFKQDWRDYYQGEGAELFIQQEINTRHELRLNYTVEELDSLPAYPRLWSLLGPSAFRSNFSSIAEDERPSAMAAYRHDGAELNLSYRYRSNLYQDEGRLSGWWLQAQYQHSSSAIASDFKYDRCRIEVRRYQLLNDYLSLNGRAVYGQVNGEAPPHRRFYLGGIRTLRGHPIKEYDGSRLALVDLEYIVNPVRTILDFVVLFDLGTVGHDSDFLSKSRWRGDFGLGVIIGEDVRIELTRPFNGDAGDLQPSVLIGRSF